MSVERVRPRLPDRATKADGNTVLVLFGHPSFHRSRVNKVLSHVSRSVPGVTFHDLYEAYPDFAIDVPHEQQLLLDHDIIVMQHPFFWYSTPAIFKEWQDLVLAYGWAYGTGGDKLRGKTLLTAISTGGPEDAYRPEGFNRFSIRELLAPLEQTAHLCGMRYLPPFVVHGVHRLSDDDIAQHAVDWRDVLLQLKAGRMPSFDVDEWPRLNHDLPRLLGGIR